MVLTRNKQIIKDGQLVNDPNYGSGRGMFKYVCLITRTPTVEELKMVKMAEGYEIPAGPSIHTTAISKGEFQEVYMKK
jgi:hypothetical protein